MTKITTKKSLISKIYKSLESWSPINIDTKTWKSIPGYITYCVINADEVFANELACYRVFFRIKASFLRIFDLLKNEQYDQAWYLMEDTTKDIELVKGTNEYQNQWSETFHLDRIYTYIQNLELLYPYSFFLSRDVVIKKQVCSICGEVRKIKNGCNHRVGKLYNGEFCKAIWEEFEPRSFAIVQNPKDKYTVLTPEGAKYNFARVKWLVDNIRNPYIQFEVNDSKVLLPVYLKNIKPIPHLTSCWKSGHEPLKDNSDQMVFPSTVILRNDDMGKDSTHEREKILFDFLLRRK